MTSKKNDVATQDPNARALAMPFDYGDHAGAGTDELTQQERGVPFLKILQAQSPEVIGPKGKIEGARAGLFLNTGNEELFESITIVPVCRLHVIQEWRPRAVGGGLVRQVVMGRGDDYPAFYKEAMARCEAAGRKFGDFWTGEPKKPGSNQLSECYQLFSVTLDSEGNPTGMVVVPFSSTAIKVYKKRFSRRIGTLRGNPPMFAFPIVLSAEMQTNEEGTWANYVINFPVDNNPVKSALDPNSAAFKAGAELYELVKSGEAKADQNVDTRDDGGPRDDGGSAF
jgi:hypothetical protein